MTPAQYRAILADAEKTSDDVDSLREEVKELRELIQRLLDRRGGRPPIPQLEMAMRIWRHVVRNPGCMKGALRPLVNIRNEDDFQRLLDALKADGRELYALKGQTNRGWYAKVYFTERQLKDMGLWPIPEHRIPVERGRR